MNRKTVADSSCNLTSHDCAELSLVPLKIYTREREFSDSEGLDTDAMLTYLENYKDKSSTACPSALEFSEHFSDDEIFCVTMSGALSGSFNSARLAAESFKKENPEKHIFVLDTLSIGPESALIIEKIRELTDLYEDFESTKRKLVEYSKSTHLIFSLKSMKNLANNGRISPVAAKMAGVLGIHAIGRASDGGVLEMTDRVRGESGTLMTIAKNMKREGYSGGKVRIHHAESITSAERLLEILKKDYPHADIKIGKSGGICSFYSERGGLIIGFET